MEGSQKIAGSRFASELPPVGMLLQMMAALNGPFERSGQCAQ